MTLTNQCSMASMLGQLCAEPTACRWLLVIESANGYWTARSVCITSSASLAPAFLSLPAAALAPDDEATGDRRKAGSYLATRNLNMLSNWGPVGVRSSFCETACWCAAQKARMSSAMRSRCWRGFESRGSLSAAARPCVVDEPMCPIVVPVPPPGVERPMRGPPSEALRVPRR